MEGCEGAEGDGKRKGGMTRGGRVRGVREHKEQKGESG